jgi:hypothetical protein
MSGFLMTNMEGLKGLVIIAVTGSYAYPSGAIS